MTLPSLPTLPTLIEQWIGDGPSLPILDDASVSLARTWVRDLGAQHGLPRPIIESLATVISELSHNQLAHARGGHVAVRSIARDGVPGLEIVAADRGDGIADPTRALHGSAKSFSAQGGSLGIGLSGARRLLDEMDLDVRWREGTCVWARKFAAAVPHRPEVALLGGPRAGEIISGDHGAFIRLDDQRLVIGLADGLGHGDAARAAADRAIAALRKAARGDVTEILASAEAETAGTRGCVMAVASLKVGHGGENAAGEVTHAGAGDITTRICGTSRDHPFTGTARVLGRPDPRKKPVPIERASFSRGEALLMFTDGIKHRASLPPELLRQRQHPLVLCHHLLGGFSRGHDDALVLVAC